LAFQRHFCQLRACRPTYAPESADFDGSGLLYRPTRRHARRVVEAFVVVDLDVLRILELEAGNSAASKARLDLQSEGVIIV
jgi:hypothetical protein